MKTKRNILRRSLVPVAALIAGGILLAGCTTPTPTPSESPSASASAPATTMAPSPTAGATQEAPKDSKDAIAQATAVAKQYWAITDEILRDGGKDSARIDAVAVGQARKFIVDAAANTAKQNVTIRGSRGLEVTGSSTSDLNVTDKSGDKVIPNGFVALTVCNDVSGVSGTNADGSPAQTGSVARFVDSLEVEFDPAQGKWFVARYPQASGVIKC